MPGFYEQYLQFEEWKSDAWDALTFRDEKSCFQCVIHGNFSADDLMVNDDRMILTSMSRWQTHIGKAKMESLNYRVLDWNLAKVIAYCSQNMKIMDFLTPLGAPQMWSI